MHYSQGQRPSISFVVPCYNESDNLPGAVTQIRLAARDAELPTYEIVVVDDCSSDATGAVAAELAATDDHIRIVTNTRNLGFGGAYKEGVKSAAGTYVIMVPGDNAHPYPGISPILRRAGEADIVIPYVKNPEARPGLRRLVSRSFTTLMNLSFGLDLPYFNGLVLHKTALLRTIEIGTNGFAYQAEALVKLLKAGATYVTVPVEITERSQGRSSAFRPRNVVRVMRTILSLRREVRVAARSPGSSISSNSR